MNVFLLTVIHNGFNQLDFIVLSLVSVLLINHFLLSRFWLFLLFLLS